MGLSELAPPQGTWSIDESQLRSHVGHLASEARDGRRADSGADESAAQYVAAELARAGLGPDEGQDAMLQRFPCSTGRGYSFNVIARMTGTEADASPLVIGAHYDHLGRRDPTTYFPGADDNASGTALLMEVAEAVAFTGRPRRTIVFAAFGAEELGLVGSRLWVQGRFSQSARPALMINADMVGHVAGGGLRVRGVDPNGALGQAVLAIAARNGVSNVSLETASWGGSDHVPFAAIGTPIAQFTTGLHGDYHTPGDVPSTLDFAGLTATARIAYELAWNISRGASALGLPAPKPPTLFDWVHDHDRMPFTEPTGGQ